MIVGNCYYCGLPVEQGNGNFAFTVRTDKKTHEKTYSDWCHITCYQESMDRILFPKKQESEERQLTIFDFLEDK